MTVVNETGQPSTADPVTADDWTWDNSPTITSRSANIGSSGTTITINGSGFNGVTGVRFGYTATYTVVNSNTITATVPVMPLGAGGTTVAVIVEIGTFTSFAAIPTADNWAWMAPAVITAMTHHTAPAGTTVTVTGTRVRRRPVRYDEHKVVTSYTVVSPTSLTFVCPRRTPTVATRWGRAPTSGSRTAPER